MQKQPVLESTGGSLAKKPHLDTSTESHQGGRKSSVGASTSFTHSREKGVMRDGPSDRLQFTSQSA